MTRQNWPNNCFLYVVPSSTTIEVCLYQGNKQYIPFTVRLHFFRQLQSKVVPCCTWGSYSHNANIRFCSLMHMNCALDNMDSSRERWNAEGRKQGPEMAEKMVLAGVVCLTVYFTTTMCVLAIICWWDLITDRSLYTVERTFAFLIMIHLQI